MPICVSHRIEGMSHETLRRYTQALWEYWRDKAFMELELMPVWWRREVKRLQAEWARRGTQLKLWDGEDPA